MKRTGYIKRKVGLKSGPLQKAKRMKAVSPKRAERRKVARERFMDGFGVYFDETDLHIPRKVADWDRLPKLRTVDREENRGLMRDRGFCFICECVKRYDQLDCHHIGRTRCDSLTNLMPVCRECHTRIQSDPNCMQEVWLAKWRHDRPNVSWPRMVRLLGRWPLFDTLS